MARIRPVWTVLPSFERHIYIETFATFVLPMDGAYPGRIKRCGAVSLSELVEKVLR